MNLETIDLNLMVAFEALMAERNVTRAARRIGLSQPAMSNALARLRRLFDDPVLVRTPSGMQPTLAALDLIGPVREALEGLRGALARAPGFDPGRSASTFHLLVNECVEMLLIGSVAVTLRAEAPGVTVRAYRAERIFQPPAASLLADRYSCAIGFYPDAVALDPRLRAAVLWEEMNVCIARRAHPRVRRRITLEQYTEEAHAAIFYGEQGPGLIDALLSQHGAARRLALVTPHFVALAQAVAATDLIATVPERFARGVAAAYELQVLAIPIAVPAFRTTLLWHERVERDPENAWLRGVISSAAATACPPPGRSSRAGRRQAP